GVRPAVDRLRAGGRVPEPGDDHRAEARLGAGRGVLRAGHAAGVPALSADPRAPRRDPAAARRASPGARRALILGRFFPDPGERGRNGARMIRFRTTALLAATAAAIALARPPRAVAQPETARVAVFGAAALAAPFRGIADRFERSHP